MAAPANPSPNRTGAWLVLAAIFILGAAALSSILRARYDTGESYPAYSSLRADPLGTRALFESLAQLPGVESTRNFERLDKLQGAPRQTLIIAGLDSRGFASPAVDAKALARFAAAGGRLVITLNPSGETGRIDRALKSADEELDQEDEERAKARREKKAKEEAASPKTDPPTDAKPEEPKKKDGKANKKGPHVTSVESSTSLAALLKINPVLKEFVFYTKQGSALETAPGAVLDKDDMPAWFSNVLLDDNPDQDWDGEDAMDKAIQKQREKKKDDSKADKPVTPAPKKKKLPLEPSPWHAIATKGGRNMIMERPLGAGTVVVCTDRYFLSNEALWKGPRTQFLSWLLGDPRLVIFEETHLGPSIGDEDGIMTLARRYRMHGLFLGGILLFALYIWRNASSLIPSNPDDDLGHWRDDAVAGESTASALEGLLRRGISAAKLLPKSLDVWEETKAATAAVPPERRAKARALLENVKSQRQIPQAYSQIRDALHPSRSHPPTPPSTPDHP